MKNKLIIDKNGQKEEYNILFKVDITSKKMSYLVYTKDEKNKEGETICYAGCYGKSDGHQRIEPIEDEYTLEFLDSVLLQVQKKMNIEVGE